MTQMAREATAKWIASLGIRSPDEVDMDELPLLRQLLSADRKSFGIFLSMVMFQRQAAMLQLVNADFSSQEGAVRAAKLQGIVKSIDDIHELMLNIADPIGEGSDSEMGVTEGVRFNG